MLSQVVSVCGTEVPRIGMGTLYITVERGFGAARPDAVALLREARRLGVRLFDTADSYGAGSAEEAVRVALHPYDGLVVTTKGGYRHDRLGAWVPDARPEQLRAAVEGSLGRLGLETIELYQLHCPDRRVPYADQVGTLEDFRREGKIRHIGISNVEVSHIDIARRESTIVSVQNRYSIRHRGGEDVLDYCESHGIVFIPWMPLGDGDIRSDDPELGRLARKHGASLPQIALSALLHRASVMLPIPGTGSIDHLRENVAAGGIALDAEDLAVLWPDRC